MKSKPTVVPLDASASRVLPPADLTKEEREAFVKLVGSVHPNHFQQHDVPLIVAYVQSMLHSRKSSADLSSKFAGPGTLAMWDRSTKMMATLATRLRLAPQSRFDAKTAHRNAAKTPPAGPKPWHRRSDADAG